MVLSNAGLVTPPCNRMCSRRSRSPTWARAARLLALIVTAGLVDARPARANGAFPDSLSILAPADQPHRLTLATNFGLIASADDGATWTWTCEGAQTNCSSLYSLTAPPADRLLALSGGSLVFSDDNACQWSLATGAGGGGVIDAFAFPQDPRRVLAVLSPSGVGTQTLYTVVESRDGGATLSDVRYTAAASDMITGVEVARTDANVWYVTLASGPQFLPRIAQSTDGGTSWRTVDLAPALGPSGLRLLAIDRDNPRRVFLRVSAIAGEALAVFNAADDTATMPVTFPGGVMTAFVQTATGALVVAGRIHADAPAYRSLDGGGSWQAMPGAPHLRALAGRGGKLYGAGDNTLDGFAVGVSTDVGVTFMPLLRFADVRAIAPCVRAACQAACANQVSLGLWPAEVCSASPETKPAPKPEPKPAVCPDAQAGCGCHADGARPQSRATLALSALLAALLWAGRPHRVRGGHAALHALRKQVRTRH
jgi:hypothetical protein